MTKCVQRRRWVIDGRSAEDAAQKAGANLQVRFTKRLNFAAGLCLGSLLIMASKPIH